jgi:hypothetical protein
MAGAPSMRPAGDTCKKHSVPNCFSPPFRPWFEQQRWSTNEQALYAWQVRLKCAQYTASWRYL